MYFLIFPLIAFNLHLRNKNLKVKSLVDITNYGLMNSIFHSPNLIGDFNESQTEKKQSIN